jgi:hypothetical protein
MPWRTRQLEMDISELAPQLYYASRLDLWGSTERLLEEGANGNAQGGRDGNALQAASIRGDRRYACLPSLWGCQLNSTISQLVFWPNRSHSSQLDFSSLRQNISLLTPPSVVPAVSELCS